MFIANNHKMHINNKLNYSIKLKFIFLENKKRTIIVPLMEYKQSSSVKSSDRRNSIYSEIASKKVDKKSIFFSCLLILSQYKTFVNIFLKIFAKILIFKVIATNTKSVAISLTQVCCNKFDTIH